MFLVFIFLTNEQFTKQKQIAHKTELISVKTCDAPNLTTMGRLQAQAAVLDKKTCVYKFLFLFWQLDDSTLAA